MKIYPNPAIIAKYGEKVQNPHLSMVEKLNPQWQFVLGVVEITCSLIGGTEETVRMGRWWGG